MRLDRYDCGEERFVWRERLATPDALSFGTNRLHACCPFCDADMCSVPHLLLLGPAPALFRLVAL